jgi:hypothetical protein
LAHWWLGLLGTGELSERVERAHVNGQTMRNTIWLVVSNMSFIFNFPFHIWDI